MFGLINNLDPLFLDVLVISILFLIVLFGVLKGIKKNLIDLLMFLAAFLLGFCGLMNGVKAVLINNVFVFEKLLPAGSSSLKIFLVSITSSLLASFVLFLLFLMTFHAVEAVIKIVSKRRYGKNAKKKSVAGRVFSGLLSLVYGLVFVILSIMVMNNNIIGLASAVERSSVTKFFVDQGESIIGESANTIVLKFYKGDLFVEIDGKSEESYKYLDERVKEIKNEDEYFSVFSETYASEQEIIENIHVGIVDLYNMGNVVELMQKENPLLRNKFLKVADEQIVSMNKVKHEKNLSSIGFELEEQAMFRRYFIEFGLDESLIKLLDEIIM